MLCKVKYCFCVRPAWFICPICCCVCFLRSVQTIYNELVGILGLCKRKNIVISAVICIALWVSCNRVKQYKLIYIFITRICHIKVKFDNRFTVFRCLSIRTKRIICGSCSASACICKFEILADTVVLIGWYRHITRSICRCPTSCICRSFKINWKIFRCICNCNKGHLQEKWYCCYYS